MWQSPMCLTIKTSKEMDYYIQGNEEKADQIKAAFEKLGYKNIHDFSSSSLTMILLKPQ